MSNNLPILSRREALRTTALAALGLPLLGSAFGRPDDRTGSPAASHRLKLGIASYSFYTLSIEQVIPIVRDLEIPTISLHNAHAHWATGTVASCREVVKKFADAGIEVTSTGVIDLPNDEAVVRKAFENIAGAGLAKMAANPAPAALPLVEKWVKETNIKVGVHNHGPGAIYPTVANAMKVIQPYDPRIGLCIDVGHSWQAGENPAAAIRAYPERLYEVHLWDTLAANDGTVAHAVPVSMGHGILNIKAVVAALLDIKYIHEAELEYLEPVKDKVLGVAESIGYLRGMLSEV
jgi:inosose dehydratase